MKSYVEKIQITETDNGNDSSHPEQKSMAKKDWVQYYANRMFKLWTKWQTSLGVAQEYLEKIKEDLAKLYDDPLERSLIETTY